MTTSTCRSCDAPILWARNEKTGKMMPLNAAPDPSGAFATDEADDGSLIAYHDPEAGTRYTSHFATCPAADQWRKPRRDYRG